MDRQMMPDRICYLGDDDLTGAAAYLAGIMSHHGLVYDHVPSNRAPEDELLARGHSLYVVSDYPASNFGDEQMELIVDRVRDGSGLVMLGGWESFHGRIGEYHDTPLADALPVTMLDGDDRCNCAQPCVVDKAAEHPILDGLPFDSPPLIGGFNRLGPGADSDTLLTCVRFRVRRGRDGFDFIRGEEAPLLIVGSHGSGRTAALATDVAPHWVGGWVDWGDGRLIVEVGPGFVEVGNWYARFFRNLLVWSGRLPEEEPG
jgi:uncharacterized membrane protein